MGSFSERERKGEGTEPDTLGAMRGRTSTSRLFAGTNV